MEEHRNLEDDIFRISEDSLHETWLMATDLFENYFTPQGDPITKGGATLLVDNWQTENQKDIGSYLKLKLEIVNIQLLNFPPRQIRPIN